MLLAQDFFEAGEDLTEHALPPEFTEKASPGLSVDPLVGQVDLELPMREAIEAAETSFRLVYLRGLMRRFKNVSAAARHAQVERANFRRLLKRGVIVRPVGGGYQLPEHLRVTIGTQQENALFLKALAGAL